MNEFILQDLVILIQHINNIAYSRRLDYYVSVNHDLINHKKSEEVELKLNYLFHKNKEESALIVSRSITVQYDQYLDEKDKIIESLNHFLYEDILTHTSFEPELNNKNDKYKWN